MRHQGSSACRPLGQPWLQAVRSGQERSTERQEGRRRIRSLATSGQRSNLNRGPGEAGSGPPGGWAGRAWQVGGCFPGPPGGAAAGEGSGAPGSYSCVCSSGHHNPAPSSQAARGDGKTCGSGCQSQRVFAFPWDRWEV